MEALQYGRIPKVLDYALNILWIHFKTIWSNIQMGIAFNICGDAWHNWFVSGSHAQEYKLP